MTRKKVIIDCDPGIDDALALMLAAKCSDVEIIAMSSCYGNNNCECTTNNLLNLNTLFNINAPVYKGAEQPIVLSLTEFGEFHGKNGLGGASLNESHQKVQKEYAWDAIYTLAKRYPQEVTLITLGPLTNLAIALLKYEDLKDYIKDVVMMGGSTNIGNETPFSEANVYHDPHAAHVVFRSNIPITMVGLNATEETRLTLDELKEIKQLIPSTLKPLHEMIQHYLNTQVKYGDKGLVIHDLAAMVVATHPKSAKTRLEAVEIELHHPMMLGRTVVDLRPYSDKMKNINVVYSIKKDLFMDLFKNALSAY